jgi:hypothetical protein
MSVKMRTAAALVGFVAMASSGDVLATGDFDGGWNVTVNCPTEGDVDGYVWQFPARVQNGRLSGKYVNPRDPENYGVLSGAIGAGGDATLTMTGKTGVPAYSVRHVAKHSPIHYTASAHFDTTSGSGKRVEQRSCDLSFAKG